MSLPDKATIAVLLVFAWALFSYLANYYMKGRADNKPAWFNKTEARQKSCVIAGPVFLLMLFLWAGGAAAGQTLFVGNGYYPVDDDEGTLP